MRFPRDEWYNALKYYQSKSNVTTHEIESHKLISGKQKLDDISENESYQNNDETQA